MIILTVLLLFVLGLAAYVFFAPFYLEIDSTRDHYQFRFHRLVFLNLHIHSMALELSVPGWKKEFALKAGNPGAKRQEELPAKKKRQRKAIPVKKVIRVLKSFKITKCYVRIDMGNMQLNGLLYPAFAWLRWYSNKDIAISFTGTNILKLEIKNSLAQMSRAWFGSGK